jgi:hypothetical protein
MNPRQIRPASVFVSKQPQLPCVDKTRFPKLDDTPAAFLMAEVMCILAPWTMGKNQVVKGSSQQPDDSFLKLPG